MFKTARRSNEEKCKRKGEYYVAESMTGKKGRCVANPPQHTTQPRIALYEKIDGEPLSVRNIAYTKLGSVVVNPMYELQSDTSTEPVKAKALCHVYTRQMCTGGVRTDGSRFQKCDVESTSKCMEVVADKEFCLQGNGGSKEQRGYYDARKQAVCVFRDCKVPADWLTLHNLKPAPDEWCYSSALREFD